MCECVWSEQALFLVADVGLFIAKVLLLQLLMEILYLRTKIYDKL